MQVKKLDNYGRGITYYKDKIMFINNALPDEEISIKDITNKNKFYESEVDKIIKESPSRVVPKCPYYNVCGGCNIMHMNDSLQRDFKNDKVSEILKKYSNLDVEIRLIENDRQLFYRNKITLKIKDTKWGYYNSKTHNLCEINSCLIANNEINNIISNHEFINIKNGEIILRTNQDKEILIAIKTKEEINLEKELIPNNIKGIILNDKIIYKDNFFYDYIGNYKFKISYNSFFQVNNFMAGKIFEILAANLKGKNLLDLYCGVGTLGISVSKNFKNIYGIEIIENAIVDAKYNAKLNGINNTHYYAGSTEEILNELNVNFDTVILDPPRSGLNNETIKQVLAIKPNQIAYVSCDPMTLARDLKILTTKYEVTKAYALEMFPNTYHIESLVLLERK